MDTVSRFKGLEAPIVSLWGIDGISWERCDELLYVGMSRAKSHLMIVGTSVSCATVESELN